jgi:hypothetical protein
VTGLSDYCFKPWGNSSPNKDFYTGCILVREGRWTAEFIESVKDGATIKAKVISWMDPSAERVKKILLEEGSWHRPYKRYVYVSRTPFALYGPGIGSLFNKPFYSGRNLIMACQVRKGELGQKPEIIHGMPATFETFRDHVEHYQATGRHLERAWSMRWVKLSDLCGLVGLSAVELLEGYLPFAERFDGTHHAAPWFMVTDNPHRYAGKEVGRPTVRRTLLMRNDPVMPDEDPMNVYISDFWARNILRLHDLGYKPGMFEQMLQVA